MKVDIKYKNSTVAELTDTGIIKLNTGNKYVSAPIVVDVVEAGVPTGDATATAADILSPKTAYIADGTKATGTISTKSAETFTASTSDQVISAGQYLGGAQTIKAVSLNANANNMLSGTSASIISNGGTVASVSGAISTWNGEKITDCLCFTANTAGSTISMVSEGSPTLNQNFQVSTNRSNWTEFIPGTTVITLTNVGDKIYFKGNNPNGINESAEICHRFVMTGSVAASGNIMSLVDNGECVTTTIPNNYCFGRMFQYCSSLTSAPQLPATTLTNYCYWAMFYDTSLSAAPELPATTIKPNCYSGMFEYCRKLTAPPALNAMSMEEGCYRGMFQGCSKLVTPPALPATTLAKYCYYDMFKECTKLTSVPALPATCLMQYCYGCMFQQCYDLIISQRSSEGSNIFTIPTNGVLTNQYSQPQMMFYQCEGQRSSDSIRGENGDDYEFYTQNPPIS